LLIAAVLAVMEVFVVVVASRASLTLDFSIRISIVVSIRVSVAVSVGFSVAVSIPVSVSVSVPRSFSAVRPPFPTQNRNKT
jgi:hypothetical protein